MRLTPARSTRSLTAAAASALLLAAGQAAARQAPPAPPPAAPATQPNGRKVLNGEPQPLAFKQVTVEQIVPFIVEATGKVVMPQQDVLTRRVTVLNDRPIPRAEALDLVLLALQQNGIAVVETATTITLRDISEITRQEVPVFGPDHSLLDRTDLGTIIEKVFRLRHSSAENYGEILKNAVPDYAKLTVDKDSNQIAVMGNVALLQRLEALITSMDQPSAAALATETFRLRYADAEQIKANIEELFSGGTAARQGQNRQQPNQGRGGPFFPGQQGQQPASTGQEIRVSANTQQNSVTVVAEPAIIEQVRRQIEGFWDEPLPDDTVLPKIYDLKNSDPVKVKTLLEGLFGRGTGSTGQPAGAAPGGQGQQAAGAPSQGQGAGRLAGQFSFQAMPDSGRLVVVAKSPDNLDVIDKIIADLDKPQTVGLPAIIELKHANAEDLAEQINTLLAQDGTLAQLRRSASGLSESSTTSSPFAQDAAADTQDPNQDPATTAADSIAFWWQRSRPPTDKQLSSNLVGMIRIVPVWRQNALMVLAPQEYKNSVVALIEDLDKPGRQVLIAAVIAEMSIDDATAFGLRWSSQPITPVNSENTLGIANTMEGTQNDFLSGLFDTSVLSTNVNLNVLLQALAQKSNLKIVSEPRIFTGDNQEAEFFAGQDIPFITESQPNDNGNLLQSFDYRAVGLALRVRPRITPKHEIDLLVNLELSAIVPGQTLFGGAIVDRRETTTQVIIRSGQTAVISGLRRNEVSDTVRKVPLLGNIPILKWLFRSVEKSDTDIEILAFITPIVVDNTTDAESIHEPYRDLMKERGIEPTSPVPNPPATGPGNEGA